MKRTIINGIEWFTYGVEYRHGGASYIFHIMATDNDDAARRVRSIAGNAELIGRLEATIPAVPGAGWWVRLRCWLRNLNR